MIKYFLLVCLFVSNVFAHEALETSTFIDVSRKAEELKTRYPAREILIVLDIDNTLLKTNQPLGSDQWFEWQSEAIKNNTSDASFGSFEDLLKAQAIFYSISQTSLTESIIPEIVSGFKRSGHNIFLLTSRSPDLRNVTERELKKNNLWFADQTIMRGIPQDIQELPFKNPVSFMNGIFMTSGHHKGEAMQYILRKAGGRYRAIIFVDDHLKHTTRVNETMTKISGLEVITFRYGKEDSKVSQFKAGSKMMYQNQVRNLFYTINNIFK